jgi:hypothetical protein
MAETHDDDFFLWFAGSPHALQEIMNDPIWEIGSSSHPELWQKEKSWFKQFWCA